MTFMTDPIMQELLQHKYDIAAENEYDVHAVLEAIRSFNTAHPAPPTPKHRKMIPGHPVGRSVLREDETLLELRKVKEKLGEELSKKLLAAKTPKTPRSKSRSPKTPPKSSPFRSAASKKHHSKP